METNCPKMKKNEKAVMFKSYYVVWKLTQLMMSKEYFPQGLNRTMQYGNVTTTIMTKRKKMV